jgi:RNA polymerase sigma-70 factor, ECF subfamily
MNVSFDRYLLIKIQDQDADVFEDLSYKYRDRLMRAAYCMTHSESDADDLVQETFVRAYKAAPKFEGKSAIYTWFYGIMRNVQLDRWRKKKHDPLLTDFSEFDVIDESGPEGITRIEIIQKEVGLLGESSEEVVRLHYFEECSVEEIASRLNIPIGTVKSRLFHARKKLKEKKSLRELLGISDDDVE